MARTGVLRSASCTLLFLLLTGGCGTNDGGKCANPDACKSATPAATPAVQATPTAPPRLTAPRDRSNFDSFASITWKRELVQELRDRTSPLVKSGAPVHSEPRLGVPSFLWAGDAARDLSRGAKAEDVARAQLVGFAPLFRLQPADLPTAVARYTHDVGRGPIIVKFTQEVSGLEVFGRELNVVLDRQRAPVALTGYLSPEAGSRVRGAFSLDAEQAVAYAAEDLSGEPVAPHWIARTKADHAGYLHFGHAAGQPTFGKYIMTRAARAKKVLYDRVEALEPAYLVEIHLGLPRSTSSDSFLYVVSAEDGAVLSRQNLTVNEAFTYRVWADSAADYRPWDGPQGTAMTPHPTGLMDGSQPAAFLPPVDVTIEKASTQVGPWLADDATETVGNNVDAYVDIAGDDGYNPADGDFRAAVSTPGNREFLYTAVPYGDPRTTAARQAGIVQLFYINNWLHDWYYDAGFDEVSGNAQMDNLGHGGVAGDPVLAEAQDSSGTNNANMMTPPDGSSPRMQMYIWDVSMTFVGPLFVYFNSPPLGFQHVGTVDFGPQAFDVTADVVYVPSNQYGCGAFNSDDVEGKIVLVDFDETNYVCGPDMFSYPARNAAAAGAVGVLQAIPSGYYPQFQLLPGAGDGTEVPTLIVEYGVAEYAKMFLNASQTVNVEMYRAAAYDRDGALDTGVIAHEWGHYITNRLIGNGVGLVNNMGGGLGEGWGDFNAMLTLVRPEDAQVQANAGWRGVYSFAGYDLGGPAWDTLGGNQAYYFGIRRVPYSTDFSKNGLTFKHISNGVPLPAENAVNWIFYWPDTNSEVHNTGEIWATMLWECYAALLNQTRLTFAEAQARMRDYFVAALKLTPMSPTLLEARDALLAAALASDEEDYKVFGAAFARRGAGIGAIAPERNSADNIGVVESYYWGTGVDFVSLTLDDSITWCDKDGYLDNDERGALSLTIKNVGADVLTGATATVTADNPGVKFPAGSALQFDPIAIGATGTAKVDVALSGATGPIAVAFEVTVTAGGATLAPTKTSVWLNADEALTSGAGDQFETRNSVWTIDHDPTFSDFFPWKHEGDAGNGYMHGADPGATEDHYLVSPALNVSLTDDFVIFFRHRYNFESGFDGGIVEFRYFDGSAWSSWMDLGLGTTPLQAYPGNLNPLAGMNAFSGTNAKWPDWDYVGANIGAGFMGATVQIRWRYSADSNTGYYGWDVDDVNFAGITNTPFPTLVADRQQCVNRRPIAVATATSPVDERTTATLVGSASTDPDGDSLTYAWAQTGGPAVTLSDATAADPTFTTPEVGPAGATVTFKLVVTDNATTPNTSLPASVAVQIRNVNRAPVANAGAAQTVNEGATVTLDGTASTDPDGDALAYTWSQTGTPAATLSDLHAAKPTFVAPAVDADTDLTFSLVVSDGVLSSAAATVTITVKHVNRAPVADAGDAQTVAEGDTVTLDGSGSADFENATLTYKWHQLFGPVVTLDDATAQQPTFTAPQVALDTILAFQLVVNDGALDSAPAQAQIVVTNVNQQPTAVASAPAKVAAGSSVTLNGQGSFDPDGTPLTYAWTQTTGPTVALSDATAAVPTFQAPTVTDDTDLTFSLVVSDGDLDSDPATVTITVVHGNVGPIADAGAAQTAAVAQAMTLDGSGSSDPDGGSLTYQWVQVGGPAVELQNADKAKATFTTPLEVKQVETLWFQLMVTDDGGLSATATTSVSVTPASTGSGCGCRAAGSDAAGMPLLLLAIALGMAVLRRRG